MATDSVHHLGVEFGSRFFTKACEGSKEAHLISKEMNKQGLDAQPERTHVFSLFSRDSLQSLAISITPFSSRDLSREGGLSISQGGHAQGVIVEMEGTEIVAFTHLAVRKGKLVKSRHRTSELSGKDRSGCSSDAHIKAFAEEVGKVETARPLVEVEARQVRSMAAISYNGLLGDSFSAQVHSPDEINSLRGMTNVVSEIALFVLFRTEGSSCCSCSCSCWGSSSCSSSYFTSG